MRYFILHLLVVFSLPAWVQAQVQIVGQVLDNATGQPLAGASVYFNHTTIGTTTRSDGFYSLPGIEPGDYELVVSYVGYERILYDLPVRSKDLRLVFRMDARVAQMRDILIVGPQTRKQWLDIFRREFLGTSPAAESTRILNEEDIFFTRSGDEKLISAFTDVPLVIENKALGYRIFFELLTFNYNTSTDNGSFFGYNHYEELGEDGRRPGSYNIPRLESYRGSTMHFFHALKLGRLSQEGFSMFIVQPASEGRRVKKNDPPGTVVDGDFVFEPGRSIAAKPKNILFMDTARQQYFLSWKGALEVTYKDPSQSANYGLVQSGDPQVGNRGTVSYIFMDADPVYISGNGLPEDPRSVRFGGAWRSERMANMLPNDYSPNKQSVFDKKRF